MSKHTPAASVFLVEVCHPGRDEDEEPVEGGGLWGEDVHAKSRSGWDKAFPIGEVGSCSGVRPLRRTTGARQGRQTGPQPTFTSWSYDMTW